jgi:hypothetical protein
MSGFGLVPDGTSHIATPLQGSWAREAGGGPVDMRNESHYPLTATCKVCRRPIRLARLMQMEWTHAPAGTAAAAGGAA